MELAINDYCQQIFLKNLGYPVAWSDPEGGGRGWLVVADRGSRPPGKSQVAI